MLPQQRCDNCKKSHISCDLLTPRCSQCLAKSLPCFYPNGPPITAPSLEQNELKISCFDQLEALLQQDGTSASGNDVKRPENLAVLGTPFISIGLLENGEISSRLMGSSKHDSETIFQAGSISKAITALAVMKLAQEGRLNINSSISTYLLPTQLSWISTPKTTHFLLSFITLRMLLSHTSGLSDEGFPGYPSNTLNLNEDSLDDIDKDLLSIAGEDTASIHAGLPPPNTPAVTLHAFPGQRFSYSSGGTAVVQLILETVLNKPFPDIMQEHVLGPLKMTRSSYRIRSETADNWGGSAAAGLWTTPHDLLLAILAIQRSLFCGGFLQKSCAEDMLNEVDDNGLGLGWFVQKGLPRFWHMDSNDRGNSCMVLGCRYPNSGICLMTSSAQGTILIGKVYAAICYLKGWSSGIGSLPSLPPFGSTSNITPLIDRTKSIDAAKAKQWCGKWGDWAFSLVGSSLEDWKLVTWYQSFPGMEMFPAAIDPGDYGGESIHLVVDGMEVMIVFWHNLIEGKGFWADDRFHPHLVWVPVVDVWQDGKVITLHEKESFQPRRS